MSVNIADLASEFTENRRNEHNCSMQTVLTRTKLTYSLFRSPIFHEIMVQISLKKHVISRPKYRLLEYYIYIGLVA